MKALDVQVIRWAEEVLNSSITAYEPLTGATSSRLYKMELTDAEAVLRLYDNEAWLEKEPDLAEHEAESLKQAEKLSVATPEVIGVDRNGKACGLPAVIMSVVDGKVELQPADFERWLDELAKTLADIHRLTADDFQWEHFTYQDMGSVSVPAWTNRTEAWNRAAKYVQQKPKQTRLCFIHRDYHPCNVLWTNGNVSGVVDWVNACRGPAGVDVAHCRVNLAQLYGSETADHFLDRYLAHAGRDYKHDPYWDLAGLFDIGAAEAAPSVYEGWPVFGMKHLTDALIAERIEQYLDRILARIK
ncbi:MAG TPA: aminoglycoside phosphotransferase family protein [Bacillales bacterium]|nr:aminoglycoside phosphotransferase family protein [Bacillales bacterium]